LTSIVIRRGIGVGELSNDLEWKLSWSSLLSTMS
jgi:hypothetical protein